MILNFGGEFMTDKAPGKNNKIERKKRIERIIVIKLSPSRDRS